MARAKWDMLLSEIVGGSNDPDAARLAGEIEREVQALEARERVLMQALRGVFARLDHPDNGGMFVNYFVRWPEIETARSALNSTTGADNA